MSIARGSVAALGALALLAGCQQGKPEAATIPTTSPSAKHTVPPSQVRHVILDAEGLAIGRNPGTAAYFAFGAPRAAVDAAGARWLGEAATRSRNDECGAGPMEFTRFGKLTLNYQGGKLAGWFVGIEPQAGTSDGIKPGTFLRDLAIARSVRMVPGSTLDGEFEYIAADGHAIGGFAKGSGRDATIESLHAGVNCFFR